METVFKALLCFVNVIIWILIQYSVGPYGYDDIYISENKIWFSTQISSNNKYKWFPHQSLDLQEREHDM